MTEPIRILVLDDHSLFREGLARLLAQEPGLAVVGHYSTIDEALGALSRETVDIVLLDYNLGPELGTNFLASVAVLRPAPRVLIVTGGMTQQATRDALAAGVLDVVMKHSGPERLIAAIRRAMTAEAGADIEPVALAMPSGMVEERASPARGRPLTMRQAKALRGILDGLANKEIAEQMGLSESAVKSIVQELFSKAGVRTRSQLVRVAIERHSGDWIA